MIESHDKNETNDIDPKNLFDQSKLSIFVKPRAAGAEQPLVDNHRETLLDNMMRHRDASKGLPGLWQEPIEEEAEEEQEYSKLKELEKRRNNQKSKVTTQKLTKLKLNFSLWERNDGFSSKRAVKRIFMNKGGLQNTYDTQSSKQMGNQGNTTLDSSDQNTAEKQENHRQARKLSLMTELSFSADLKMSQSEEEAILSSLKAVFSETQFDSTKTKRPFASSFTGNFPETSNFDPEDNLLTKSEAKDSQIERPNSLVNLKAPHTLQNSNCEKRLNPSAANFFIGLDAPGSDSKLPKKPQKKTLRVSEADGQSYILDPSKSDDDSRTSLYIRNIPNKYTQRMLIELIDQHFQGKYDFFYLPIDYKNKCNLGYAFMNFSKPTSIKAFYQFFNGKKWAHFNSDKVCDIRYGRIQGIKDLVEHFKFSSVMNHQDSNLKPFIADQ
jgi:hypothetical protein